MSEALEKKIQDIHVVPDDHSGKIRIVDYLPGKLSDLPTKSSVKKAIKKDLIIYNGHPSTTATFIQPGDQIKLLASEKKPKGYNLTLEKVYEDDHLVIVNKPPGIMTNGNAFRTLENALVYNYRPPSQDGALSYPRPVHRLDSATRGLLIAAKTVQARVQLSKQFEHKEIEKIYQAIVMGRPADHGEITHPIEGKKAQTLYHNLRSFRSLKNGWLSLLELSPKTGRTHQLRIHCAKEGFPIYGDGKYATKTIQHKGLFLAAIGLKFQHPINNQFLKIKLETPVKFIRRLENEDKRWKKYYGDHQIP